MLRMRRGWLAALVLLHGIGHASIGVWAATDGPIAVVNTLWGVALVGYVATACALWRLPVLRRHWKGLMIVATVSSIILLTLYGRALGMIGIPIDLVLVFLAFEVMERQVDSAVEVAELVHVGGLSHPLLHRVAWTIAGTALVYVAAVVALRPTYLRWGSTPAERAAVLPGDPTREARYRVDHAITIHAPADSVWPWLVQLGQDRGGFYSYTRLERLIGDEIRNADRIHPEWQHIEVGDTIRATQADYLGGRFGTLGWRVSEVVPGQAMVLERWGTFAVLPVDSTTSRFIVRTRNPGEPTFAGFVLGPLNVFVFEPAHFIMQRGMLMGVRDRAEGRAGSD